MRENIALSAPCEQNPILFPTNLNVDGRVAHLLVVDTAFGEPILELVGAKHARHLQNSVSESQFIAVGFSFVEILRVSESVG